jgi:linoleoyl-CoA desaturase
MRVKFAHGEGFYSELKKQVDAHFKRTGISRRDNYRLYLKMAILLLWAGTSYALLLLMADAWWQGIPLAIALGLSLAGIGFNLQHDGSHGAFSRLRWVNRTMACMLDLLGGSSYVWHWKHNVLHHSFPNISGADDDIANEPLVRMTPYQPRHWWHRFQHLYAWLLYGLLPIKWQFLDDFHSLLRGRIGAYWFPRPRRWQLAAIFLGKGLFLTWAMAIPWLFHSFQVVLLFYLLTSFTLGLTLSVVFQLSHCVEGTDFLGPLADKNGKKREWAVHQVQTTIDFARRNYLLTWYIGGLNYQIEHHLFPHIAHVHYPRLARIIEQVCSDFGIPYRADLSFWGALRSHRRWLYRMGRPLPSNFPVTQAASP